MSWEDDTAPDGMKAFSWVDGGYSVVVGRRDWAAGVKQPVRRV